MWTQDWNGCGCLPVIVGVTTRSGQEARDRFDVALTAIDKARSVAGAMV